MDRLLRCVLVSVAAVAVANQTSSPAMGLEFEYEVRLVKKYQVLGDDYPYKYEYELLITQWDDSVPYINDFHLKWPRIFPGYVRAVPPEGWLLDDYTDVEYFQYGFYTEDEDLYVNEEGSLRGWEVELQYPAIMEPGEFWLTQDGGPVSVPVMASFPTPGPPSAVPTLPGWALVALGGVLIAGGAMIFARRRRTAVE